jgi:hypothetical protein
LTVERAEVPTILKQSNRPKTGGVQWRHKDPIYDDQTGVDRFDRFGWGPAVATKREKEKGGARRPRSRSTDEKRKEREPLSVAGPVCKKIEATPASRAKVKGDVR